MSKEVVWTKIILETFLEETGLQLRYREFKSHHPVHYWFLMAIMLYYICKCNLQGCVYIIKLLYKEYKNPTI